MKTHITITKLERAEHHGDWHDKLIRWAVNGPAGELQKFATKKEASGYKSRRLRASSQLEAINAFVAA